MHVTPTGIDVVTSIFLMILMVISGVVLVGAGVLMAVGAIFSKRPLVTSWPTEQEHSFSPFEQHSARANSLAWLFSLIGAGLVLFVVAGIYFAITPEENNAAKDMNMSNLTKRRAAQPPPPKPDAPAPAEAPKPDTPVPAEAPKP